MNILKILAVFYMVLPTFGICSTWDDKRASCDEILSLDARLGHVAKEIVRLAETREKLFERSGDEVRVQLNSFWSQSKSEEDFWGHAKVLDILFRGLSYGFSHTANPSARLIDLRIDFENIHIVSDSHLRLGERIEIPLVAITRKTWDAQINGQERFTFTFRYRLHADKGFGKIPFDTVGELRATGESSKFLGEVVHWAQGEYRDELTEFSEALSYLAERYAVGPEESLSIIEKRRQKEEEDRQRLARLNWLMR